MYVTRNTTKNYDKCGVVFYQHVISVLQVKISSGWGQVTEHEEPAIRPVNNNKMVESSPPRPAKSEQARLAMQRRAMSDSPPPAVPQRGLVFYY